MEDSREIFFHTLHKLLSIVGSKIIDGGKRKTEVQRGEEDVHPKSVPSILLDRKLQSLSNGSVFWQFIHRLG